MSIKWDDLKNEIQLTDEEMQAVKFEENLIETFIRIREEKGISQAQLAKLSQVKQPAIARLEKKNHSPQVDSLLRLLVPLGYTLEIVPLNRKRSI